MYFPMMLLILVVCFMWHAKSQSVNLCGYEANLADVLNEATVSSTDADPANLFSDSVGYQYGSSGAYLGLDANGEHMFVVGAITMEFEIADNRGGFYFHRMNSNGALTESVRVNPSDPLLNPYMPGMTYLGMTSASLGDTDGDSITDGVAVGSTEGLYLFYFNPATFALTSLVEYDTSNQPSNGWTLVPAMNFGWSVSNLGDLDGNGIDDLAVGAPGAYSMGDVGTISILYLDASGTTIAESIFGHTNSQSFIGGFQAFIDPHVASAYQVGGGNIAVMDDWAGGSSIWLVQGDYTYNAVDVAHYLPGAIYLFKIATSDGTLQAQEKWSIDSTSDITLPVELDFGDEGGFGTTVGNVGDLDNNGMSDLLTYAFHYGMTSSLWGDAVLTLIFVDTDRTVLYTDVIPHVNDNLLHYYDFVVNMGDINNDNVTDLLIGDRFSDDCASGMSFDIGGFGTACGAAHVLPVASCVDCGNNMIGLECDMSCNSGVNVPGVLPGEGVCDCTGSGATGVLCETDLDDCVSSPCQHSGVCADLGAYMYNCTCASGYSGFDCETDDDDCMSSPCMNAGTCTDTGADAFSCDCEVGFEGNMCESDVDDCASSPCENGATCSDTGTNSYACACDSGWEGYECEEDVDDCLSSPCYMGVCSDTGTNTFMCDCSNTGYTGMLCNTDIDDCASSPCQNNGICNDLGAYSFDCDCVGTGFEGMSCEENVDECLSAPCPAAATCVDNVLSFTCVCPVINTFQQGLVCDDDYVDCADLIAIELWVVDSLVNDMGGSAADYTVNVASTVGGFYDADITYTNPSCDYMDDTEFVTALEVNAAILQGEPSASSSSSSQSDAAHTSFSIITFVAAGILALFL